MSSSESPKDSSPAATLDKNNESPAKDGGGPDLLAQLPRLVLATAALSFALGVSYLYGGLIFLDAGLLTLVTIDDVLKSSLLVSPAAFLGVGAGLAQSVLFPEEDGKSDKREYWSYNTLALIALIALMTFLFLPPYFAIWLAVLAVLAIC